MSTAGRLRVICVVPDLSVGDAARHTVTPMSHLDRTTLASSVVGIVIKRGCKGELR